MPRPEDSGGPASPCQSGWACVAFGSVKSLGVRNKPFRSCTSTSGCAVTPTAYRILCLRFVHLVRRVYTPDSAMDARLDTGGWLTLTRQGLSPCKRRQACLGAITLGLSRAWKPQRGTSGATVLIVKGASYIFLVLHLLGLPGCPMFQHSIENGQQLMHTRCQSDFFDFPRGEEPLVKNFDLRVVARGHESPHV